MSDNWQQATYNTLGQGVGSQEPLPIKASPLQVGG
jgi:hypothetical protein